MYTKIRNPQTNRDISIYSKKGKQILKLYLQTYLEIFGKHNIRGGTKDITIVFIGGGVDIDVQRREFFKDYNVVIAGDHPGADIGGDWNNNDFWERIKTAKPSVLVLDPGSDSWLSDTAINELYKLYESVDNLTMILPNWNLDKMEEQGAFQLFSSNFQMCTYSTQHPVDFAFALNKNFPEQSVFPGEILANYGKELVPQILLNDNLSKREAYKNLSDFVGFFRKYTSYEEFVKDIIENNT